MRLSQYFIPTLRETPKEAQIVSHRLMLRAGMINNPVQNLQLATAGAESHAQNRTDRQGRTKSRWCHRSADANNTTR